MAEYIEREALLQDISETVLFSVRGGAELPTPEMRGANKVIDRIKSAPTADVVEVRHGEWFLVEYEYLTCDKCGHWYYTGCESTAEAKRKINGTTVEFTNGFMISYAPADDPQIAVVIAIENVTSGGLGNYVRDVYEAYFNSGSGVTNSQQSGTVLS